MDVLSFRDYCLSLPLTEETTPFDETTLVYKIGGKMYACADMEAFEWIAVKCDPDEAI
ncbi:MAG: MmcQ/YjbR family DNA-binding protein, partial [Alistipes senegalensis]